MGKRKPRSYGLEGMKPRGFKRWATEVPHKAMIEQRRTEAIQYRASGMPLEMIGRHLHADRSYNIEGRGVPGGYGWKNLMEGKDPLKGANLASAVARDVNPALETAQLHSEVARQQALELELYRLDMASAGIWPGVLQGRARDLEVWLKLSERRAKLLGLDKAEKIEHSGEQTLKVAVEGRQPDYSPGYAEKMFEALEEVDAFNEGMPALPGVVDTVAIEAPAKDEPEYEYIDGEEIIEAQTVEGDEDAA